MRFEYEIAKRYVRGSRKNIFTSITTFIAIIGITLSVCAIFITLSIINGFQSDIRQKIFDSQPNIIIYGDFFKKDFEHIKEILLKNTMIKEISPFIISQAILLTPSRNTGVVIKGIEENEFKITNILKSLKYGSFDTGGSKIVLGEELAKNLGVFIEDEVVLVSPKFDLIASGILPKMKKFKVSGIINTGYYEYDSSLAFIDINDARTFFNKDLVANGISVKLKDVEKIKEAYTEIRKEIPFYYSIKTYYDINKNLFAALKLEKFIMGLILSLIILVSSFSIASNLFMITSQKLREIGILLALGVSKKSIRKIFILCGVYMSVCGIILGFIGGSISLYIIKKYQIIELPKDIYYITNVPVRVYVSDIFLIVLIAITLSILSSILPARYASRIDPAKVMRYG
jgi:lipoprotein-releasing system permease protein